MKLVIRTRHVTLEPELRAVITRRLHFALTRHERAIEQVDVTLGDVNGPKGGVDKVCRIRLRGPGLPPLVIEEAATELRTAVDSAAARLGRTLQRALTRRRDVAVSAA